MMETNSVHDKQVKQRFKKKRNYYNKAAILPQIKQNEN